MSVGKSRASGLVPRRKKVTVILILSYVFDWIILIAVGVVATILGNITPNMRPFSLEDPNISYAKVSFAPRLHHSVGSQLLGFLSLSMRRSPARL